MPVITDRVNVAAATTLPNVLAGSVFERLRANSRVQLGVVAVSTSAPGDIRYRFSIGDSIVVEDAVAKVEVNLGEGVLVNQDLNVVDVGFAGDLLSLAITNTDGVAAHDVTFYVLIV